MSNRGFYVLVCEGACGRPFTQQYDEAARKFARDQASTERRVSAVEGRATCVQLAPMLVHTVHSAVQGPNMRGMALYRCVECETERTF